MIGDKYDMQREDYEAQMQAEAEGEGEANWQAEAQMELDMNFFFDLFVKARNNLSHADYVEIWGEQLGNHVWRQEGSDLLRIWSSGLKTEEKQKFVRYLIKKQLEWKKVNQ